MKNIQKHKSFYIGEGIILILLGILAISWPSISTLAIEKIIGWLFIIGGIAQLVRLFHAKGAPHIGASWFLACLYLFLGITFIVYPFSGAITLTLLLLIGFIFQGVTQLVIGFKWSPLPFSRWMVISGFLSIIIGLFIWSGWPSNATWVLGLLVGINLIVFGAFQLMLVGGSSSKNIM